MQRITEFQKKVYEIVKKIPEGSTLTYGEVAQKLGMKKGGAQAVGQALKVNPFKEVPCHRVIKKDGTIGGFAGSDKKNIEKKRQILRKEGVNI